MLDSKFIKANLKKVKEMLSKRFMEVPLEKILELEEKRARIQTNLDQKRAERKKIAHQTGQNRTLRQKLIGHGKKIKEEIETLEDGLSKIEKELNPLLLTVPNMIAPDVPTGRTEEDNKEIKKWGKPKKFDFSPLDHVNLGEKLDVIDLSRGAKVAGSGFYYLKNEGALLELGLVSFAFKNLTKKGFIPVFPPEVIRERMTVGTGFQPRSEKEKQIYKIEEEDLYLIATAEIPLVGLHADEVLPDEKLPLKYVGFSTSFRTEAGSWGKDVRGILRTHQFDKVEMFVFTKPDESDKIHQELLGLEEELYQALEIPYRVVSVCSGDLGSPAYKKYDIEAWIPSQNRYREITSCSNTTDYQARRLNIKYRKKDGSTNLVYTLNATACAIGRTLIAILENYQNKDGSVDIPKALKEFVGTDKINPKN